MRIVFMGTPDFAVPVLQALAESEHCVAGVFCQPDRAAGRGKKLRACAVKNMAVRRGLPVFQPESVITCRELLTQLQPDCIVVAAFGQILPEWMLEMPAWGCVNVHASLLPLYRGAAPIHRAVMNGEAMTGVCIMRMDKGLDTGDVLASEQVAIEPDATMGDLHDVLAEKGARLLLRTLGKMVSGAVVAEPQPQGATYAAKLTPDDECLVWSRGAWSVHNQIRGLNPWPGAYTYFLGEKVKVWLSRPVRQDYAQVNGVWPDRVDGGGGFAGATAQGFLCRTGWEEGSDEALARLGFLPGVLEILEVQPAGKKRMSGRAFYNGRASGTSVSLGWDVYV